MVLAFHNSIKPQHFSCRALTHLFNDFPLSDFIQDLEWLKLVTIENYNNSLVTVTCSE